MVFQVVITSPQKNKTPSIHLYSNSYNLRASFNLEPKRTEKNRSRRMSELSSAQLNLIFLAVLGTLKKPGFFMDGNGELQPVFLYGSRFGSSSST